MCLGPRKLESHGRTVTCPECGSPVPDFSSILRRLTVPHEVLRLFPIECIHEWHCIPVAYDNDRSLATLAIDFSHLEAAEFFGFVANREVEIVFADRAAILDVLDRTIGA